MNIAAQQLHTEQIAVDEVFPHAAETIWKVLSNGGLMARWLGMKPIGFEPVVGNCFTFQTTSAGKWDGTIHCEVLELIKNRRFAITWQSGDDSNAGYGSRLDSVVTFTLDEVEDGTRLAVVHSGFIRPQNDTAYSNLSGGWKKVISRLGAIAGESD